VSVVDVDGLSVGGDDAVAEAGDRAVAKDQGGGGGIFGGGERERVRGKVDVRDAGEDGDVVCGSGLLLGVVCEDGRVFDEEFDVGLI